MTSHVPRRQPKASGARFMGKSESVYYNLQYWLFLGLFGLLRLRSYYSQKPFSGGAEIKCNVAWVRGTICVASKSLLIIHLCTFRETQNYPRNDGEESIHIIVPSHERPFL